MFYKAYAEELIKVLLRETSLEKEYIAFSALTERRFWSFLRIMRLHALEIPPSKANKQLLWKRDNHSYR